MSEQNAWDVAVFMNRAFNASAASRTTPSVGKPPGCGSRPADCREARNYFCIIMSCIIVCMSFWLTMPLLPFFILSYMDS